MSGNNNRIKATWFGVSRPVRKAGKFRRGGLYDPVAEACTIPPGRPGTTRNVGLLDPGGSAVLHGARAGAAARLFGGTAHRAARFAGLGKVVRDPVRVTDPDGP